MATCRECLHQELCDTYSRMGVTDVPADDITICELFKPKSDYVKRERGEWIVDVKSLKATCSVCGHILNFSDEMQIALLKDNENFCYYCGADNRKD